MKNYDKLVLYLNVMHIHQIDADSSDYNIYFELNVIILLFFFFNFESNYFCFYLLVLRLQG